MVRAAVVGLGWWGKHIVRRMRDSAALQVALAMDTSPSQADFAAEAGVRFTTNWNDVLSDPEVDAVILCTPHSLHVRQVLDVASSGKHVFCEKPLALSRSDALSAVEACRPTPKCAAWCARAGSGRSCMPRRISAMTSWPMCRTRTGGPRRPMRRRPG